MTETPEVAPENTSEVKETKIPCKDWEEIFTSLAVPSCNKCYGRGYVGWIETAQGRMPKACAARNCAMHKFMILQQQARRRQLAEKKIADAKVDEVVNEEPIVEVSEESVEQHG